jgi:hypothetical protein
MVPTLWIRAAHDPEKPAPDVIRGGQRFSDKIMRKQILRRSQWFAYLLASALCFAPSL